MGCETRWTQGRIKEHRGAVQDFLSLSPPGFLQPYLMEDAVQERSDQQSRSSDKHYSCVQGIDAGKQFSRNRADITDWPHAPEKH